MGITYAASVGHDLLNSASQILAATVGESTTELQ